MRSRPTANLGSESSTKRLVHVKRPHPMDKNIQGKKLAPSSTDATIKKLDPKNKGFPVKRTNPTGNMIAKKTMFTKTGAVVKKLTAVKKPGVATKMAVTMNKSEPVKKEAPATKVEPPKKITEVKKVVTVDNAMAEKNQSLSATKKDTTIPPAKEIPREEDKEMPPATECKKPSLAKLLTLETEHENKVWQEFSYESINKEEQSITDKSGNEAGDDLKNIQGLNINKEQLNIQNSLYVKMLFADRPPKGTLTEFINKYNFQSFKRIDNGVNLFAAKLNNTDDFEIICNAKEVYCGQVKVTVKPCYKHSLNQSITTTDGEDYGSKCKENREEEKKFDENVKNEDTTRKEISEGKSAVKSINETEQNEKSPENPKEMKNIKDTNACNTSPMKPDNLPKVTKSLTNIEAEAIESNVNIKIDNSSNKEKLEFSNDSGSVNTNNLPIKPINITTKQTTNKLESKDISESKVTKDTTEFKVTKDIAEIKASKGNNRHEQIKVVTNLQKDSESDFKEEVEEISERTFEDDEEMDDQDILALISEGIVLDECCDSDQEL